MDIIKKLINKYKWAVLILWLTTVGLKCVTLLPNFTSWLYPRAAFYWPRDFNYWGQSGFLHPSGQFWYMIYASSTWNKFTLALSIVTLLIFLLAVFFEGEKI